MFIIKWFKHMTDALDDSFIDELMDEFGHFGYVAWFGIIELIARENGHNLTGKATFRMSFLRRKLRTSSTKLRLFLDYCQSKPRQNLDKTSTKPRLLSNISEGKVELCFPKILELKDNYLKDLQVSSKQPSIEEEEEVEVEEEVEKEKKKKPTKRVVYSSGFLELWEAYPNRTGKANAFKSFKIISPNNELLKEMVSKVNQAKETKQWSAEGGRFVPHLATWLNQSRWEDEHMADTKKPKWDLGR